MARRTLAALALVLTLAGCSASDSEPPEAPLDRPDTAEVLRDPAQVADTAQVLLAEHGLDGISTEDVVDRLDRLPTADRPNDLTASVRVNELLLAGPAGEAALDLPDDRFYLSVAPYTDGTHECFFHSLTTCRGELGGQDVQVTIVDDAGQVLLDEVRTTYDNGFVGFWLPRDIDGTIQVAQDGRSGAVEFSTREDSPTCLTTLQLV